VTSFITEPLKQTKKSGGSGDSKKDTYNEVPESKQSITSNYSIKENYIENS